jgi:hypothetical protein
MPRVDTMSRTIGPVDGKKIMIFQEDAAMVFGIPFSGKEVYDSSLDKSATMRQEVMALIGMEDCKAKPSDAAFKTLSDLAGRELNEEEEAKFKVSFAVFVVWMLCDGRNPGEKESVNFWPALKCPAQIHTFNWASYVLDSVISACVNARMATRSNTCYSPPAGTVLFLQVLRFLFHSDDNRLNLSSLSRHYTHIPITFLLILMAMSGRFFTLTTWIMVHFHWPKAACHESNCLTRKPCPNR